MSKHSVVIVAHRGGSWDAPENTLSAIKLGWDMQADATECDIHITSDDQVVLLHDSTLARTGGVDTPIASIDLATARTFDVGVWKGEAWKGEKIPLLSEALATVPAGKKLLIEIKAGVDGVKVVPALKRVVNEAQRQGVVEFDQLHLISFNADAVKAAKEALPLCRSMLIVGGRDQYLMEEMDSLIRFCKENKMDGLNIRYTWPINKDFTRYIHDAGLKLFVWTVNDLEIAQRLVEAGVDGITTDRPNFIRAGLRQ